MRTVFPCLCALQGMSVSKLRNKEESAFAAKKVQKKVSGEQSRAEAIPTHTVLAVTPAPHMQHGLFSVLLL